MAALNIGNFGGMIPAVSDYYLPDNQAALSENAWVYSGNVKGFKVLREVRTLKDSTRKVHRIPSEYYDKRRIPDSYWLEFDDPDTDVVRSPIADDNHGRYYWASPTHHPLYNTQENIIAGLPPMKLGVPAPSTLPTVSVTGGAAPVESRVYVYTWVTAYGEEGPPSSPSAVTSGNANGSWSVSVTAPNAAESGQRNLKHVRIYRAVTSSSGVATYFLVAELPIATSNYTDTTVNVSGNNQLQSLYWDGPPDNLQGMISMPNGMVAGFRFNEVWFCEPYRMHAWPSVYTLSVNFPIVGLGVIGQTIIVCTTVSPYAISGINPASMSMTRLAQIRPCLSRGSILSTPSGVIYSSTEGLMLALPGGATNITKNMISKDKWEKWLPLNTLRSAVYNDGYYCWGSQQGGIFQRDTFQNDAFAMEDLTGGYTGAYIDFNNQRVAYNKLATDDPVLNTFDDVWTGEVFILKKGKLYWLDAGDERPNAPYKWKSKIFSMPKRQNLEAMRVWFDVFPDNPTPPAQRNTSLNQTLAANQLGLVRVYADNKLVMCRELREDGEFMRLPSGFKAASYQVELEARVKINSVELSSSAKELVNV